MSKPNLSPRKRRRRLAITLRVLMLLVLVVAAGLGWKVNRAHVQRQAAARIERAGGHVSHDYTYTLAGSSWAPDWLRRLESVSVSYYLSAGAAADARPAQVGESGPIRSFRFQGVNPNTLPPITESFYINISSNGVKTTPPPSFEKIDTLTIDQIESARSNATLFDEELAPATAALLLESAPIKADHSVELATVQADRLVISNAGRKAEAPRDDARALWERLERRDTYESPWQPAWLQRLIGDEYFQEVTSVSFHGEITDDQLAPVEGLDRLRELTLGFENHVTDAGLAHLAGLTRLQELDIWCATGITDAGLAHLAGLIHLRKLLISKAPGITDAGLVHLAKMTELRDLDLSSTGITDAGLAQLARLPHLEKLHLFRITDAGMSQLAGLTELRELNLSINRLTDAGMAHLAGLTRLQTLNLSYNRLTNEGLVHLAGLTRLQTLDLSHNRITDAGLRHLRGLRQLRKLDLDYTWVRDEAVAAARDANPALAISRRGRPGLFE